MTGVLTICGEQEGEPAVPVIYRRYDADEQMVCEWAREAILGRLRVRRSDRAKGRTGHLENGGRGFYTLDRSRPNAYVQTHVLNHGETPGSDWISFSSR